MSEVLGLIRSESLHRLGGHLYRRGLTWLAAMLQ